VSIALATVAFPVVSGQQRGRGGPPPPPQSAQQAAPIDLTGYWVSVVTEDWRWRMATPPKGDYQSLPLNQAARKVADAWDLAKDDAAGLQCKPYGAGNIMRQPGRLHITWQDENTLKVEFDAGTQTRLFYFGAPPAASGAKTWQGTSTAAWERPGASRGDARVRSRATQACRLRRRRRPARCASRNAAMFEGGSLSVRLRISATAIRNNGVPVRERDARRALLISCRRPAAMSGSSCRRCSDPAYSNGPAVPQFPVQERAERRQVEPTPCRTDLPEPRTKDK
jgi:hypothetical protein